MREYRKLTKKITMGQYFLIWGNITKNGAILQKMGQYTKKWGNLQKNPYLITL